MMNAIFDYTDYHAWLRDAFDNFKKEHCAVSWRYLAAKIGGDPGNLLRVTQGKIQLSIKYIQPIAKFFSLDEKQSAYWTELVLFGRAKSDKEALDHYEKMLSIANSQQKEFLLKNKDKIFFLLGLSVIRHGFVERINLNKLEEALIWENVFPN